MPLFLCKKITAALKEKSAAVIFMLILIPNQPIDKYSDIIIQFCVKLP